MIFLEVIFPFCFFGFFFFFIIGAAHAIVFYRGFLFHGLVFITSSEGRLMKTNSYNSNSQKTQLYNVLTFTFTLRLTVSFVGAVARALERGGGDL